MSRKFGMITLLLSLIAIVLALIAMVSARTTVPQGAADSDVQYVMYLGTNDKDTVEPVFTPEESMEKTKDILVEHFGGYTIQEASGGWKDGDQVYQEYTMVIYLSDTDIASVHRAADELIRVFNQSSVLIQSNQTATEFYEGK